MKKTHVIIATALAFAVTVSPLFAAPAEKTAKTQINNVIILIPDGMSVAGTTLARYYQNGSLALDEMASGLVNTANADTPIADSAPAGTAMATGFRTNTPFVGVLPKTISMPGVAWLPAEDAERPIANILEAARLAGKSTGIVATSEIMHATPADFSSHDSSRSSYDSLNEQQVYNNIDVVFGGGSSFLTSTVRKDKEDMIAVLKNRGYQWVTTRQDFDALKIGKVWGLFAPKAMSYDLDRDPAVEPSLAEMTSKAISLLKQNKKGFFLMVEGSKVDWAAHANDAVGMVTDILAFDKAVKAALDFAKADGHTIVIAVTDHGNSGISLGDMSNSSDYYKTPLATFMAPLKAAKKTLEGLTALIAPDRSNIKEIIAAQWGIKDLSEAETTALSTADEKALPAALVKLVSSRAKIGFTTNGHTGEDVVLYAYSPDHSQPSGLIRNSDIAWFMASSLGLDLNTTTKELYQDAKLGFAAKGASVAEDLTDPENPVLVVIKDKTELKFPRNKSFVLVNGKETALPGVTVFNAKRWFVSQTALNLIK